MDFSTAKVQLNLMLGDADNFTFTDDQKTQALTAAWNDSWVINPVWDISLTFSQSSYQNTLPSTITTVSDVYIQRASATFPEPISAELWEVVNGVLQWNNNAKLSIPDGTAIYIRGAYKLTTADSLTKVNLQNYVLANAGFITLKQLSFMRVNRFLRNDTTLGEILGLKKDLYADMIHYREQLQREYVAN
jgi:hypothetical protein